MTRPLPPNRKPDNPDEGVRTEQRRFRLTPAELVRFKEGARFDKMSLSGWLRMLADKRIKAQRAGIKIR